MLLTGPSKIANQLGRNGTRGTKLGPIKTRGFRGQGKILPTFCFISSCCICSTSNWNASRIRPSSVPLPGAEKSQDHACTSLMTKQQDFTCRDIHLKLLIFIQSLQTGTCHTSNHHRHFPRACASTLKAEKTSQSPKPAR